MSIPYNAPSRLRRRRKNALENLNKQIEQLAKSTQGSDSSKLDRARECAVNLIQNIDTNRKRRVRNR